MISKESQKVRDAKASPKRKRRLAKGPEKESRQKENLQPEKEKSRPKRTTKSGRNYTIPKSLVVLSSASFKLVLPETSHKEPRHDQQWFK